MVKYETGFLRMVAFKVGDKSYISNILKLKDILLTSVRVR